MVDRYSHFSTEMFTPGTVPDIIEVLEARIAAGVGHLAYWRKRDFH